MVLRLHDWDSGRVSTCKVGPYSDIQVQEHKLGGSLLIGMLEPITHSHIS